MLEAGILQKIHPEERKRQEVRGASDVPGVQHECWRLGGHVAVSEPSCWAGPKAELGSAELGSASGSAALGLGSAGWDHPCALAGKRAAPSGAGRENIAVVNESPKHMLKLWV